MISGDVNTSVFFNALRQLFGMSKSDIYPLAVAWMVLTVSGTRLAENTYF